MPPIELGPTRPVAPIESWTVRASGGRGEPAAKAAANAASPAASATVVRSDALDPGAPPVDLERVRMIRKAVESGTYPVVPAKIADAIIAAGILLRTAK